MLADQTPGVEDVISNSAIWTIEIKTVLVTNGFESAVFPFPNGGLEPPALGLLDPRSNQLS